MSPKVGVALPALCEAVSYPASPAGLGHTVLPTPSALLLALEMRAPWEFGAVLPAWFAPQRAPRGDGHPAIVFPGLSASDASTAPLRTYLRHLGYNPSG